MRPTNAGSDRAVAIVSGGGTGVGAASARHLASRGLNVAVLYANSRSDADGVAEICRRSGVDAVPLQCNVANDADCRRVVVDIVARWGRADVVVNAAGTTQFSPMSDLEALSGEDFQAVFAVNTIGPYQMARAAAPHLRKNGGVIVNVSSVGSLNGNGSSYAYVTSKAALNALTVALARNLAPEIRVNAVLPGLIDTEWLKRGLGQEAYTKVRDNWSEQSALQKYCAAEDVAGAIVWLALDAPLVTGQLLTIDGGFLLGRPTRVSK